MACSGCYADEDLTIMSNHEGAGGAVAQLRNQPRVKASR